VLVEGLLRGHWLFHSMGDLNPLLDHMTLSTPPLGDVITWQVRTTYSLAWHMHPFPSLRLRQSRCLFAQLAHLSLWPMRIHTYRSGPRKCTPCTVSGAG
jgi:hypothetical protein